MQKAGPLNQNNCNTCALNALCLPIALDNDDLDRLDEIIKRSKPYQKGEYLYRQGDKFNALYAIKSGTVKTYTTSETGEEQITSFHLPSELAGLSGYDTGVFPQSAKVLETTSVCELPIDRLEELSDQMPGLRRQLMRNMSGEMRHDQQMMMLLSKKNADERLASFLIDISERHALRGFSSSAFRLAMSRIDVSNYLGLAVETVSRIFTRFQKKELISTEGKEVKLLDREALISMAGLPSESKCD